MTSDWVATTIGDACDSLGGSLQTGPFGSQLHANEYLDPAEQGVPVVPTSAIRRRYLDCENLPVIGRRKAKELARHRLRGGDILFARRGAKATGLSALIRPEQGDWICGTGAIRLRFPEGALSSEFLSFQLASKKCHQWIRQNAIGATMPNLNEGVLRRIPIALPPLEEQRRIAEILGAFDDKIELNRKMNRTLEAMAQTLFKSWFVDFAGHDGLVDSELGPIPRGWRPGELSELAVLQIESIKPSNEADARWEHFSIPAYDAGEMPTADVGRSIKSNKYRVPADAVLVSKLNPRTPRVWMVDPQHSGHAVCSTEFMPFVPKSGDRVFLFELLQSQPTEEAIQSRVTGSTGSRQRVKPKEIVVLPIVIPPGETRSRFDRIARPFHDRRLANLRQSRVLAEIRDTLLPKLISGEIRVPEVEEVAEAVL